MDEIKSSECISSMDFPELESFLADLGEPPYRAKQVFHWLHQRGAGQFEEMTDLPAALRERLVRHCTIAAPQTLVKQTAKDGTEKFLFALTDGQCVESVLMRHHHGNSLCVSTQVGCRMGCRFCASGQNGLVRGLSAGEMAGQVYAAGREAPGRISHLVLMGIGEPLDNLAAVLRFLAIITNPEGAGLSMRNVTLSTCGVVPGIRELAKHRLPLTLSVSLHAAFDEKRSELMPVNRSWPIAELLAACRDYAKGTRRRLSFEYALVPGVNDTRCDAEQLARLLRPLPAHLNLIAVNPVAESGFAAPAGDVTRQFAEQMRALGINTTMRRRLGEDIDAACGQLRASSDLGASAPD